jgi:hypothetical protein
VYDRRGVFLEHVFFKRAVEVLFQNEKVVFTCVFNVIGVSGSTGVRYEGFSITKLFAWKIRVFILKCFYLFYGKRFLSNYKE